MKQANPARNSSAYGVRTSTPIPLRDESASRGRLVLLLLLGRAEVFVGEGTDALKEAFSDHALIASLGLRSIVNVPLMDDCGDCFATFNVLTHRDKWEAREVIAIRLLVLLATPAVALEASKLPA